MRYLVIVFGCIPSCRAHCAPCPSPLCVVRGSARSPPGGGGVAGTRTVRLRLSCDLGSGSALVARRVLPVLAAVHGGFWPASGREISIYLLRIYFEEKVFMLN